MEGEILKRLVSEGSGKEVECPAAIKTEREEYRKAQDQSKLLENLERAVLDNDIDTLNRTNQSSSSKWRLTKHSVLKWINNNRTALQLRHFPKGYWWYFSEQTPIIPADTQNSTPSNKQGKDG